LNAVPQPTANIPPETSEAANAARVAQAPSAATARRRPGRYLARPLWIVAICVAFTALRLGRDLLIPVVLAVLLALVLSGIVETLRRYRVPRGVSALVLLLLVGGAVGGVLHAVWTPAH